MTEPAYLADNLLVYLLGTIRTEHWPRLAGNNYWSDQLRLLASESATWQFELQAPDCKIVASYNSHRGLEKRINADEEQFRDWLPYNTIQWAAKFEDGSGWHGSVPVLDWCNLAWGLRSVRDDDNQIVNWLWIMVKERAED
ncbi:MAG: hypothetical protein OXG68_11530 [Chloroflexi bacterium]|nr:hypothetical protein [Chloroflexota bacterium]